MITKLRIDEIPKRRNTVKRTHGEDEKINVLENEMKVKKRQRHHFQTMTGKFSHWCSVIYVVILACCTLP